VLLVCAMGFANKIAITAVVLSVLFAIVERQPASRTFPIFNILRADGYSYEEIPDLSGKVVIITGANTGLGYASALAMYRKNAHVILTARTVAKGEEAKKSIMKEVGETKGKLEAMELELSSLRSVERFATAFEKKKLPLHVLMLNAGIMAIPYELSADGIEMQFAVNHVAHQYLTNLLLPILKASAPSRIVALASGAHAHAPAHGVGLSLEQINDDQAFSPPEAYGQSKLANIFFVRELAKKLNGTGVTVNAVHPGFVRTELVRNLGRSMFKFVDYVSPFVGMLAGYDVRRAALTQLYVATSPDIEKLNISGQYYVPVAQPETQFVHAKANDFELQRKVWDFTEALIKQAKK